jgi:hypothetical protein
MTVKNVLCVCKDILSMILCAPVVTQLVSAVSAVKSVQAVLLAILYLKIKLLEAV